MDFLSNVIYVFTDGGIKGQVGKPEDRGITIGSHAYILYLNGKEYAHAEAQRNSTSNREELLGILHALQKLKRKDLPVVVTSDSRYCVNSLTLWMPRWKKNNWISSTKEPVKNKDILKSLDEIISEFDDIKFEWVRGHSGHPYNERCDAMCQQAIKDFEEKITK
jgi:ribonuclease HI